MYNKIERFVINKLWGEKTVDLKFKDNKLIIVGENGSGKTTILRIIYETLACKWSLLSIEEFESIEIYIENSNPIIIKKEFIISAKELFIPYDHSILRELPLQIKRKIMDVREISGKEVSYDTILELLNEYGYSDIDLYNTIQDKVNSIENEILKKYTNDIKEKLSFSVIYMPKYRRVEKNISYNERLDNRYNSIYARRYNFFKNEKSLEIAKTGMDDVGYYIDMCLDEIKRKANISANRLNYQCFKGILNKTSDNVKYNKEILRIDAIEKVFGSLNEDVLSKEESEQIKNKLIDMRAENTPKRQSYEQIVYYFYHMLYERYEEIKKDEKKILNFFEACNKYLSNKKFVYNAREYSYSIFMIDKEEEKREIKLEKLSSGEKQVVSMFNYLYLSPIENTIILIDEPEMSLSVPWQKKYLLDIVDGGSCVGIVAVTHSPFVFDNNLKPFAKALEQFIL